MILFDSVAVTNRGIYVPGAGLGANSGILIAVFLGCLLSGDLGLPPLRHKAAGGRPATSCPVFWISLGLFFVPSILFYFILGDRSRWTTRAWGFNFPAASTCGTR
jgi:general L-amino acid transport system permease protein